MLFPFVIKTEQIAPIHSRSVQKAGNPRFPLRCMQLYTVYIPKPFQSNIFLIRIGRSLPLFSRSGSFPVPARFPSRLASLPGTFRPRLFSHPGTFPKLEMACGSTIMETSAGAPSRQPLWHPARQPLWHPAPQPTSPGLFQPINLHFFAFLSGPASLSPPTSSPSGQPASRFTSGRRTCKDGQRQINSFKPGGNVVKSFSEQ